MPKERIPSPGGMNLLARLISKIKSGLGIVEETNTATHTIAAGKYVTWKGNVYRAKSAIPSGTTLSSSNLETLSDGGLNDLSGLLNSNIGKTTLVVSATSISAFETGINSILASMQDTEVRALRVTSSITNNGFKSGVTYSGYITRLSSGWGSISLVDHTGVDMIIGISGGAYFYNSLTGNKLSNKATILNASSLSDLKTVLIGLCGDTTSGSYKPICYTSAFTSDGFVHGDTYQGFIFVNSQGSSALYFSVVLFECTTNMPIYMRYTNGTWNIDGLALNSKINNYAFIEPFNLTTSNQNDYTTPMVTTVYDQVNGFGWCTFIVAGRAQSSHLDQILIGKDDYAIRSNESGTWSSWVKVLNSKLITTKLMFDGSKFPTTVAPGGGDNQVTLCARNEETGAIYVVWYSHGQSAFMVESIISGSAPTIGQHITVQYLG